MPQLIQFDCQPHAKLSELVLKAFGAGWTVECEVNPISGRFIGFRVTRIEAQDQKDSWWVRYYEDQKGWAIEDCGETSGLTASMVLNDAQVLARLESLSQG